MVLPLGMTYQDLIDYAPDKPSRESFYTVGQEQQLTSYNQQGLSTLGFLGGVGLTAGSFYTLSKFGVNPWNSIYKGIRTVEEFTPGHIFRTFQLGNLVSQFTTEGKASLNIASELINPNSEWFRDLIFRSEKGVHGLPNALKATTTGLQFREGTLYAGEDVVLRNARKMISTGNPFLAASYSRASGYEGLSAPGSASRLRLDIPTTVNSKLTENIYFTGGPTKSRAAFNQAYSLLGEWTVERVNRLAHEPLGIEPFTTGFSRLQELGNKYLGFTPTLAVKSGTPLQTLGRQATKWGLGTTAAVLGYQTVDWAVRNTDLLNNTIFDKGVTAGIASIGIKANLLTAGITDFLPGLRSYQETQEEFAPGSTSLTKLAAFPLSGALAGATGYWMSSLIGRARSTYQLMQEGLTYTAALSQSKEHWIERAGKSIFQDNVITRTLGNKITALKNLDRLGASTLTGAVLFTLPILPFLPGALLPSKSTEELRRIYSGEQEVPVMKGADWETGKCLTLNNVIPTLDGFYETPERIKIGDILIGRNNQPTKVLNIFTRHYKGEVLRFNTAFDRDKYTEVTGNHIIPVLRNNDIIEISADQIKINDFVEVPFTRLSHALTEINTIDFLSESQLLEENNKYFLGLTSRKGLKYKSGQHSVPKVLSLDYDLGLLFGYYLAEGNLSFNRGLPSYIETVHAHDELSFIMDIKRIVKEKFNSNISYKFSKKGKKAKAGFWIVRICSSILARLFKELFYNIRYCANEKRIPIEFFSANIDFKKGLIEGYWRGDGHIDGTSQLITSSRKWLLEEIQLIGLNLDVCSGISPHHVQELDSEGKSWRLRFSPSKTTKDNNYGCKLIKQTLYTRIRSIQKHQYDDIVFDFEVDHPDHLFQAGVFLVHNSPFEGTQILAWRPHWFPRMLGMGKEKSIEDESSPITNWIKQNFTYDFEREHYYDRPFPISGSAFQDIPVVGPILAATIGRLVKPPVLMHTDQWLGDPGEYSDTSPVLRQPGRLTAGPPTEAGTGGLGTPIESTSITQSIGEQAYRMTELSGLTGFAFSSLKKLITGEEEFFDQEEILQQANKSYGAERSYWDLNIGSFYGSTEFLRRLLPHKRRQIEEFNPIRNQMPDWIPGPGERATDFQHGDPYSQIPEGEIRLPGPGFATRFPELKNVAPEDYSDTYRYKILSDIAPYAERTKNLQSVLTRRSNLGKLSSREDEIFRTAKSQLAERKEGKEFYQFEVLADSPDAVLPQSLGINQSRNILAAINNQIASKQDTSVGKSIIGGYWEGLAKALQNPLEALTPLAPGSKFLSIKSAIQSYRETQIYGSSIAFWNEPLEDFLKPFTRETADMFGFDSIPEHVQQRRGIEEYFDVLKYIKNKRLAEASIGTEVEGAYGRAAGETLVGINPYTRDMGAVFRAAPAIERDYIDEFLKARSGTEREEILNTVAPNIGRLLSSQWEMQYIDQIRQSLEEGTLDSSLVPEAEQEVENFYTKYRTEGFPTSPELLTRYEQERQPGESYANWYRRTIYIPSLLETEGLPGPDWVGFSARTSLNLVKLKVVKNAALDIHDFNLWPSDERAALGKDYLDEAAEQLVETTIQNRDRTPQQVQQEVRKILSELGIGSNAQIKVYEYPDEQERIAFDLTTVESREEELRQLLEESE